jgi:ABC-type sulfate transport system permease subunit
MSFAENTFRVPESWRLTRGNIWRMFLVAFGLVALMIISEIVLLATGALALSGGAANLMQAMRSNPFSLLQNLTLPGLLIGAAVGSVFGVLIYTLGAAAWADIYRQLKPPALDETFA